MPEGRRAGRAAEPAPGAIGGVVWRDFKPGGGKPGKVEQGELGIPGVTVELHDAVGQGRLDRRPAPPTASSRSASVTPGTYRVGIGAATFATPFAGVSWLGTRLITPSIIIAYTWIWAGFAMVVIGAGLAAIPRDVLEAARTDGATRVAGVPPRHRAAAGARSCRWSSSP